VFLQELVHATASFVFVGEGFDLAPNSSLKVFYLPLVTDVCENQPLMRWQWPPNAVRAGPKSLLSKARLKLQGIHSTLRK
jgi:hypothetical protein